MKLYLLSGPILKDTALNTRPKWLAATIVVILLVHTAHAESLRPVPLIFDTDIGNDVDDVLALGMIHALQSRGECKLLAVTITKDHELAAPFADAVNTFYGRGEIPIGVCRSGVTPGAGKFNPLALVKEGDVFRYPHDLLTGKEAPEAVAVLRETLANAEDRSVVIAQVGFSTNLANLLVSKADDHSKLTGIDLVTQKVKLLSIMAGGFDTQASHKEFNVVRDIAAAKRVAADWPTPVVWSGFEIGLSLEYPHQSIQRDFNYVEHHPLAEAYKLYIPPPHNRPTWDLTSVLYAIRPNHDYFLLSSAGQVSVADDGKTSFQPSVEGKQRRLIVDEKHRLRILEALQLLSSQPPTSFESQY